MSHVGTKKKKVWSKSMSSEIYTPELIRTGRSPRLLTTSCEHCYALVRVDIRECFCHYLTASWACPGCYFENITDIKLFFDTDDEILIKDPK